MATNLDLSAAPHTADTYATASTAAVAPVAASPAAATTALTDAPAARPARPDDLKDAFRSHPAGVALITADAGDGPVAMTATSLISVSVEPPLMAFSASAISSSTPTLRAAESVAVHFLAPDQLELAKLGATSGIDRFADTSLWQTLPDGTPVFHDAEFWIRAEVVDSMDGGGSTVFLVEAVECADASRSADAPALVYRNRTWHAVGEQSSIA